MHVRGDVVTIKGGSEIEGASCVVYYKNELTENSIYKIEVAGYDPAPEPAPEPLPPIESAPAEVTSVPEAPAEQTEASETPAEQVPEEENG